MESSHALSRFLPHTGSQSVYETIRQHDDDDDDDAGTSDVEERAGLTFHAQERQRQQQRGLPEEDDEEEEHFSDRELEEAIRESQLATSPDSPLLSESPSSREPRRHLSAASGGDQWPQDSPTEADERDDDVPPSLLVETHSRGYDRSPLLRPPHPAADDFADNDAPPIPGPSTRVNQAHWDAARAQQPLYPPNQRIPPAGRLFSTQHAILATVDPKEKAMWRWANVENLDNFLKEVYSYFLGNGMWSIMLSRVLDLL